MYRLRMLPTLFMLLIAATFAQADEPVVALDTEGGTLPLT